MAAKWNVDRNDGNRATLSNWAERMTVERPSTVSTEEFSDILRPGTIVIDRVVKALLEWEASGCGLSLGPFSGTA
jgi:hypothetical protein